MTFSDNWDRPAGPRSRYPSGPSLAVLDTVCGTPEGYLFHRSRHELACGDCSRAWDTSPGIRAVERDVCGTNDGWRAHRRRKEWACPRCAEAREIHERELCGSEAGWMIHRRAGTVACDRCREFIHRRNSERRTARRDLRRRPLMRIPLPGGNPTGSLRRAANRGMALVCVLPQYLGQPVHYAPRWDIDNRPWALTSDPTIHLAARECRAADPEESTTMSGTRQQVVIPADTTSITIKPVFGGFQATVHQGEQSKIFLSTGDVTVGEDRTLTWYAAEGDVDWDSVPD